MRMVKRWGVMTLVALLVLGSMGAALADEPDDLETDKKVVEPGLYPFILDLAEGIVAEVVLHWGQVVAPSCPETDSVPPGGSIFLPPVDPPEGSSEDCILLELKKPNHGSMVSSFVHWLKDGGALPEGLQDMNKGELVREFAHYDFGKGWFELPAGDAGLDAALDAEDDDGNGPPAWVEAKKAEKNAAKGKNK